MQAQVSPTSIVNPGTVVLGLLAGLVVYAGLASIKLPLVGGERPALIVFLILGMAMCANGIGKVAAAGAWLHPLAILGYLLGAAILVIGGVTLLGGTLPFVSGARQALTAVAALSTAKLAFSIFHRLISRA